MLVQAILCSISVVDSVKTLVFLCTYLLYWFRKFTVGRLNWPWFVLWTRVVDGYAHAPVTWLHPVCNEQHMNQLHTLVYLYASLTRFRHSSWPSWGSACCTNTSLWLRRYGRFHFILCSVSLLKLFCAVTCWCRHRHCFHICYDTLKCHCCFVHGDLKNTPAIKKNTNKLLIDTLKFC